MKLSVLSRFALGLLPLTTLLSCSQVPQTNNQVSPPLIPVLQFGESITPIKNLQANQTGTVHLKGRVGQQVPLLGGKVYELQDNTGSIWVLTKDDLPPQGDEVLIKGQVRYKSIPLAGKEQGSLYIEQLQQLQRNAAPAKPAANSTRS